MIREGSKVTINSDPDHEIYQVIYINSNSEVSLGLLHYPDVEQDNYYNINELTKYRRVK